MDWSKEAIQNALNAFYPPSGDIPPVVECMRAALDAAIKAQGMTYRADVEASFEAGRLHGRAEALEEAAKKIENWDEFMDLSDLAEEIRALK